MKHHSKTHHPAKKLQPAALPTSVCPAPDMRAKSLFDVNFTPSDSAPPFMNTATSIVVDAGHGYLHDGIFDPGETKGGHYESDITMAEAKAVGAELEKHGYHVVLTRDDHDLHSRHDHAQAYGSRCLGLAHRVQMAAKVAQASARTIFISLHVDSAPDASMKGITVFSAPGDDAGKALGKEVSSAVNDTKKSLATHSDTDDLFVLHWNKAMHVTAILIETGFATNSADLLRITSESGRAQLAKNIAEGVDKFLQPVPTPAITMARNSIRDQTITK